MDFGDKYNNYIVFLKQRKVCGFRVNCACTFDRFHRDIHMDMDIQTGNSASTRH